MQSGCPPVRCGIKRDRCETMIFTLQNAKRDIQATAISSAVGGEGQCYRIDGMKGYSVKIYTDPVRADLEFGLKYFLANPPSSIVKQVAWPLDIVESGHYEVKGYLQHHFPAKFQSFTTLASPLIRPRWATAPFIRQSLQQVAYLIAELHAYGYLYPDLHSEQFLVEERGTVVLVDTASCQFSDAGTLFPCDKIRPETQAPELFQGKDWNQVAAERSQHTDAWSLSALIFETLMECHPFDGIYIGPDKPLPRTERIKQGFFPYETKATHDYRPPKNAPPYRHLDQEIQDLFHRCFVEGHAKDKAYRRPTAGEWSDALRRSQQPKAAVPPAATPTAQAAPVPSVTLAAAVRTIWDRAVGATNTVSRNRVMWASLAAALVIAAVVGYRFATDWMRGPTVNRLRSVSDTSPYPVQFNPAAPSVDSVLSRMRGHTNPEKE